MAPQGGDTGGTPVDSKAAGAFASRAGKLCAVVMERLEDNSTALLGGHALIS